MKKLKIEGMKSVEREKQGVKRMDRGRRGRNVRELCSEHKIRSGKLRKHIKHYHAL